MLSRLPPSDPTAVPSAGTGRRPSPWELDHEWRTAPRKGQTPARAPAASVHTGSVLPSRIELDAPEVAKTPSIRIEIPRRPVSPASVEQRADATPPRRPSEPRLPPAPHSSAPTRPAPLRLRRSRTWPAVMLLSFGLLIFVFVAWQYLSDVKLGADDDLRPSRPLDQTPVIQVPKKLRIFLEALVIPEPGSLPVTPPWLWETPRLSKLVRENSAALDNLRDLLEEADWHPAHSAWHETDIGSDPRWRMAFLVKQAEAAYIARRGQEEDAFVSAVDLADLAWRLEQIWAWPSFYSRSLEAHEHSAQSLAELLRNTRLSAERLRVHQREFSARQPKIEALTQAIGAYYFHEKKILLGAESKEPADTMPGGAQLRRPGRLFFKPNATLQLFADEMRQLQMEVRAPVANTGLVASREAPMQHQQGRQPNSEGLSYFASRMAAYRSLPAQHALARARSGLVGTLFALHRHVGELKTLPATLEALSPRYLEKLPADPFSASPLLYDRARGWLWSSGTDLKSQGGQPTSPPMEDDTEPTVEIGIKIAVEASK